QGGCWHDASRFCRAANGNTFPPSNRYDDLGLRLARGPVGIRAEEEEDAGFSPLFNGKNLDGWKPHDKLPGNWRVENGVLIGSGPTCGFLYTKRDDYKNFHLRVQARIKEAG